MHGVSQHTSSLCPYCLRALPAALVRRGDTVFLERVCPEHGPISAPIWQGAPGLEAWRRPERRAASPKRQTASELGCPNDCGICPEHKQFACTVLLEITGNCNLNCPVCFASSGKNAAPFTPLAELVRRLKWIREQAGDVILQISGGEPTLYPDLPALVRQAKTLFEAVQLNSNGLELARKAEFAHELREAGLTWVFLQFDGATDEIYRQLRGRPLLEQKLAALANCARAGLPVVLVPTVARGVNDRDLGNLLRLALQHAPNVRGIHFQPMSVMGRNAFAGTAARITIPELLRGLAEQSNGLVEVGHFSPPGCEHERCSFHSRYRLSPEGALIPQAARTSCCPGPEMDDSSGGLPASVLPLDSRAARENIEQAMRSVRSNWGAEKSTGAPEKPLAPQPRTLAPSQGPDQPLPNRFGCCSPSGPDSFEAFLQRPRLPSFSLTGMAFQDAWTVDLQRLQSCCVHVYKEGDRIMPFCAYNLTNEAGRPLHRR